MRKKLIFAIGAILIMFLVWPSKDHKDLRPKSRYTWYARYIKIRKGDSVWYDRFGSSLDTIPPRTYKKDSLWVIEMEGHVLDSDRNRITLDLCKFKEK